MGKGLFASLIVLSISFCSLPLRAHETDQTSIPLNREMPDLADYFTRFFYNAINEGVTGANKEIAFAVQNGFSESQLKKLQSPENIAIRVNQAFPNALAVIENLNAEMISDKMKQQYPGQVVGFRVVPANIRLVPQLRFNPFGAWGCTTMKAYGVYFGADKMGHLTDMGRHYYSLYRTAMASGKTDEQAVRVAIEAGMNDPWLGESKLLGYWTAADYSNGDLAINYVGLLFYRNLTEPQMLKGQMRPPMVVRDGAYWKIAPHVRLDSDFMSWFFSEHLDETLNSGLFSESIRGGMRENVAKYSESVLEHRLDRWGNRNSQAWFAARENELRTYYGFDYGHDGKPDELVLISRVCFAEPKNPADRDAVGRTPLHRAVARGDAQAVNDLLSRGADINAPVRSNESFNSNWGDTPLHLAAQDGNEQMVQLLITKGADVNRRNDRGNTPLHRAVETVKVMNLLLDAGAKVDLADAQGRTPLHWAAMGTGDSSLALLLARGADVNHRDAQRQTPLHLAARFGDAGTMQALLKSGADVNAADQLGATPLHVAAASKQGAATTALLSAGAVADAKDDFGCTPLHDAARRGSIEVATALLKGGAQPSIGDDYGTTPLHLAAREGFSDVAVMLASNGASPALRAGNRGTPVDEARRAGFASLANELASMPQTAAYRY